MFEFYHFWLHSNYYFTSVSWINESDLAIIWLNRAQNHSIISICKEQNNYECMNVSLFSMFCMIGFDKVFIIE